MNLTYELYGAKINFPISSNDKGEIDLVELQIEDKTLSMFFFEQWREYGRVSLTYGRLSIDEIPELEHRGNGAINRSLIRWVEREFVRPWQLNRIAIDFGKFSIPMFKDLAALCDAEVAFPVAYALVKTAWRNDRRALVAYDFTQNYFKGTYSDFNNRWAEVDFDKIEAVKEYWYDCGVDFKETKE